MKAFKIILALTSLAGIVACSSNRTKTTETKPEAAPIAEAQLSAPVAPSQPTYTVANLGASSAGRAK